MAETMRTLMAGTTTEWEFNEVPVPVPGPGEVLVRNLAAATNEIDGMQLRNAAAENGGPADAYVAGWEFAGEVAGLGDGVQGWRVGDAVMGTAPGAFAQYVLADARHLAQIPQGVDALRAAALPTGLATGHGALRKAGFTAGNTVLVTGAATGIGLLGTQLAKVLGASRVFGTTRSPDKSELLSTHGVDDVIVSGERDMGEAVLAGTGGKGVDVVLDHIAGQTFADCLPITAAGGHVVNIGRLAGAPSKIDIDALSYRNLNVQGVSYGFGERAWELGENFTRLRDEVVPAVGRGEIRPVIDSTFDWENHAQASARLLSGAAHGKIVLAIE